MHEEVDRLRKALGEGVGNLVYMSLVDSTHAMAVRLVSQMDDEGLELLPTLIIAGRQTRGQGRGERTWASPTGGLYLSWLRSGLDTRQIAALPMLAAAAARDALAAAGLDRVGIKWPNDLLIGRRKLAGIVVHARHGEPTWVTVGLGINVSLSPSLESGDGAADRSPLDPEPLQPICLAEAEPATDWWNRIDSVIADLINGLESALRDPRPGLGSWRRHLVHRPGEPMTVRVAGSTTASGLFAGLTDEGFLRLLQDGAERVITSGDVVGVV